MLSKLSSQQRMSIVYFKTYKNLIQKALVGRSHLTLTPFLYLLIPHNYVILLDVLLGMVSIQCG